MARTKITMQASRSLRKGAIQAGRKFKRKGKIAASRTSNIARATVVSSLLAEESKFFDTSFAGVLTASTDNTGLELDPATVLCLNAMAQGDTASTREGNKTVVTGVNIRGLAYIANAEAQAGLQGAVNAKLYLVQDTQTTGGSSASGTQLNSEDVFSNQEATVRGCFNSFRNQTKNPGRYRVLASQTVKVWPRITQNTTDDYSNSTDSVPFEFYWKGMIPVKHQANNGTIADIADNSLHVIGLASGTTSINYTSRVYFKG